MTSVLRCTFLWLLLEALQQATQVLTVNILALHLMVFVRQSVSAFDFVFTLQPLVSHM